MWCYNDLSGRWLNPGLESPIVILIASVLLVGACIIHAIDSLRKSIEDRSKSDNPDDYINDQLLSLRIR